MAEYHEAIQLAQKLVQIPSENPTGNEDSCSRFVENWFSGLENVKVTTQMVEPGRTNVIAKYKSGSQNLAPLVIIGHMDTVPVEGTWSKDPFGGEIENGKLYGRGSCDMKSGLASAMVTLKEVSQKEVKLKRDLFVIASIDEEGPYMKGSVALVEEGLIPENAHLIATEPTNLTLSTVHKGTIWYEINIQGKSAHGGNAHLGADAGHAAAEVITRLKKQVNNLPYNHEIFGRPAISVGIIQGGQKTNMVTGSVRIELDFRLVPPMTKEEANDIVREAVKQGCREVTGTSAEVKHYGWERPPLESSPDTPLIQATEKGYMEVMGEDIKNSGFPAYTDVSMIGLKTGNRNLIVFGPGHLDQAHAIDEFVDIQQIEQCTNVLFKVVQN
ncbi:succinyl-diaminopimelate desuccinylase [Geomicrobium halophilum]|uniref:Probable succinyl-diaminopimelate desuccinylase n=1 Tax=Geomicrobium halophilum TaxID=549000 RepID=A0A841PMS6_9BACL|nr:M20 family metallopeptidase [Geomicrobium halophilum]MBB6450060.1 succinyl-diaminopimelate desuccinylase [Geomicrobium halophilum]